MEKVLLFLILFQVKHFVIDFPLQFPYMYLNKGKYGHFGGILHALLHAVGTGIILYFFTTIEMMCIGIIIDLLIHYHVDWAKMKINVKFNWLPNNSAEFWVLLGFDQLLHQLTYIGLVYLCLRN